MGKFYGDEPGAKDQWAKLKGAPFKDKVQYIAQYYGLAIGVTLFLIILAISLTKTIIYNSVPNVIAGEFYTEPINEEVYEDLKLKLCNALGYDPKKYHIDLSTNLADANNTEQVYYQYQKLMARIAAKDLDFIQGIDTTFAPYISAENPDDCAFYDLRNILSAETLARLEAEGRLVAIETDYAGSLPYAIDITGSELYNTLRCLTDRCLIGFPITAPHLEALEPLCELIR